jgi:beta-glucosidase
MSIVQKLVLLLISIVILSSANNPVDAQPYLDSSMSVEVRVNDLLSRMSLDEKIGQMTQIERQAFTDVTDLKTYFIGSILSGGGSAPETNTGKGWADMYDSFQAQATATPLHIPLIYGIDAVHGHNNVKNAVIFPHNIGLGCTRNPQLVEQAARITALEIMGTGLNWTFAPCIAVTRDERWGRTYEGFGETPALVAAMGVSSVKGLQGDSLWGKASIVACAKHYIGDGGTTGGRDQGNTEVDEQTLRELYLPAYIEAINAGVGTVMASYSSWNGQKMHGHKYLLTDVLKEELGFDGFVISDWAAIDQLPGNYEAQVESSINAGVDMIMLPYNYKEFIATVKSLVSQNRIQLSRIDDAVKRILRIKFRAGLFEHPYSDRTYTNQIGSAEHRAVARESVRQSLVLLTKKDNVLPLPKNNAKIHIAGKNANDMGNQCGGWSITWQGSSGDITSGTTILEAVRKAVGTSVVTSSADGSGATGADFGIAVIGETPYAEGQGDRADLSISPADVATVRNLKQSGIPVIVIIISGRPMLINRILPYCDAIIAAWLPGTEGDGVADVLFGDHQPTGLLSNSWPESMQEVPVNFGDAVYTPLFEFGHGITSLQNSEQGSAPQYFSSCVSPDGASVEVSFNKNMSIPDDSSGFSLKVEGLTATISGVSIKEGENTTLVLSIAKAVGKSNQVMVSYTPGNYYSADGGKLEAFSARTVYNILNENKVHQIPGIVQAEDFFSMSGVQTENTTDAGGGMNVGWIETGDWMDYYLDVPVKGIYKLEYRVSSLSAGGEFTLKRADTNLVAAQLPVTGGWQTWRSVSVTCKLDKGLKLYRQAATKGGFNFNWFNVTLVYEIDESDTIKDYYFSQNYPNPFYIETKVKYTLPEKGNVTLALIDLLGKEIAVLVSEIKEKGEYSFTLNRDDYQLKSGSYFLKFQSGEFSEVKKIVVR